MSEVLRVDEPKCAARYALRLGRYSDESRRQ